MPNKFYSLPKSVFEHYHAKLKDWVRAVLPTKTSDLTNDSDFLDQLALAGIIAVTFSASSTYKVGDYVLYNHTLYRCKTAITTAGAWDASKWDAAKTQDIFKGSAPGLVPAAESVDADKVLKGDGTWGVVRFEDVDLKDHIKSEYPIEIKSSASGTYVTLTLDGKVLFVAEYGKTTYAELRKHIERKDILILNVNGTDYCTNYNISDSFIEFYNTSVVNGVSTTKRYILNSNDNWTYTTDTSKKLMSSLGSINVNDDGIINIGCSKKVNISAPSLYIGTDSIEGSLSNLVYKDIVKNVNSDVPVVLFGTNKSDQIQTNSSIPNMSGMITFFAGYDPSMGPIINYVNNNVSKLKVLMKNDVTYDSILSMYNASPYLPILNTGSQYYYPHYAAPGYGFSWFNFTFNGKDQTISEINYYFLSPDNTWSTKPIMIPSEGLDNTDIKTIISGQKVVAELKTETIDIEV